MDYLPERNMEPPAEHEPSKNAEEMILLANYVLCAKIEIAWAYATGARFMSELIAERWKLIKSLYGKIERRGWELCHKLTLKQDLEVAFGLEFCDDANANCTSEEECKETRDAVHQYFDELFWVFFRSYKSCLEDDEVDFICDQCNDELRYNYSMMVGRSRLVVENKLRVKEDKRNAK
jgi:hypothetical protein